MDKYAGSKFRLGRGVDDPFEDHHKHQVAKETQHEEQLRNQLAEYAAHLAKVASHKHKGTKEKSAYIFNNYSLFKQLHYEHIFGKVLQIALRHKYHDVSVCRDTVTYM